MLLPIDEVNADARFFVRSIARSFVLLFALRHTNTRFFSSFFLLHSDSWRLHYPQLNELFAGQEGFSDFMLVIANNTLRDSIYGMVYRVTVGALLSTVDAATDIYTISTYYESDELVGQANALLAMMSANLLLQLIMVIGQYKRKTWDVKLREELICLFFLKPVVDAYRVSTNHEDEEAPIDPLSEVRRGEHIKSKLLLPCAMLEGRRTSRYRVIIVQNLFCKMSIFGQLSN